MNLYELKNIVHDYNGKPVLKIEKLQIPRNTIVGLAGPNGSGKSTLLRLLGFIERPSQGRILFDGHETEPFSLRARKRVTSLPQDSYLLKRSVYHNLAYGLRLRNDRRNEEQRIQEALEWVGLEAKAFTRRPWYALSGGEARRVSLAARLVLKPNVLLLDEPTTSVDAFSAMSIKTAVLQAYHQWHTTLIVASHDMEWLQDISHHMLHLFRGRILDSGQPTLIFGPWEKDGKGHALKRLPDNQHVQTAQAPEELEQAVAAIDAGDLYIAASAKIISANHCSLEGTLIRLSFDHPAGRINALVLVGDTTFCVHLVPDQMRAGHLVPGHKVFIGYNPQDMAWLE